MAEDFASLWETAEPVQEAEDLSGLWSQASPVEPAPVIPTVEPVVTPEVRGVEDRTVLGTAKDIGVSALKGIIALPQAAVGLLDIPTGGYAGKLFEKAGYRPEEAQRILSTFLSPAQQAASKEVAEAEGFLPTVEAAIKNPSVIAQTVIESAPSMIGGAGIARGILKVAPKLGALVAAAMGEGAVAAGSAAEELRSKAETGLITPEQSLKSLASGVGTGLFGLLGGRIAKKAGIADVDTLLAGGARKITEKGVVRRMVEGGLSEGLLEELPQSAQETMWMNSAEGRPLMEGVGSQSAMGMLAGVAMGGGFNVIGSGIEGEPSPTNAVKSVVDELVVEGLDPAVGEQMIADFEEQSSPDLTPEENINILSSLMEDAGVGVEEEITTPEEVIPEEIIPETTEAKVATARENIKAKASEVLDTIEPETDLGQQVKGMLQDELAKAEPALAVAEEAALPEAEIVEEAPVAEEAVLPEAEVLPEEVISEVTPQERAYNDAALNLGIDTAGKSTEQLQAEVKLAVEEMALPEADIVSPTEKRADFGKRREIEELFAAGDIEGANDLIFRDPMTGNLNRRAFEHDEPLAIREGKTFASIDMSGLKWVNDSFGHEFGDELLKLMGGSLSDIEGGNAYRIGGDEYAVIIDNKEQADIILSKVKEQLADTELEIVFEDGSTRTFKGWSFDYATAETYAEADKNLTKFREELKAEGKRVGRGGKPLGLIEVTAQRIKDKDKAPREEVAEVEEPPPTAPLLFELNIKDGVVDLDNPNRQILEAVKLEVEAGEAGKRVPVTTPEGETIGMESEASTFPKYFQDKQYKKKPVLIALNKALGGKKLARGQEATVVDLHEGFQRTYPSDIDNLEAEVAAVPALKEKLELAPTPKAEKPPKKEEQIDLLKVQPKFPEAPLKGKEAKRVELIDVPKEIAAEKAQVKIEEVVKEPAPEFSGFKSGRVRIGKSPQAYKVLSEVTTKEEEAAGERYFEIENEKTNEKQIVTFEEMKPIKAKKEVDIPFKRRDAFLGEALPVEEFKEIPLRADIEAAIDIITTKWKNAPPIHVRSRINQLPSHLQDAVTLAKGEKDVEGIFDPETKSVYLIAGNIDSLARAKEVLFHESLGHFGIRGLLGKDIDPVLNQVYLKYRKEAQIIAKQYGFDVSTAVGRRQAAEEVLAGIAQKNSDVGILKKAFAVIRNWLRKMGFDIKLSDNDIRNMMADAAQFVKADKKSLSLSGPPVFSKKPVTPTVRMAELRKAFEKTAKRKPASEETDEDARKIDAPGSKAREGVQRWAKRYFTKEGLLNKVAFEKKIEMDSAKNVGEQDVAAMVTDFNKAVSGAYGVKKYQDVSTKDLADVNKFMAGKEVTLPAGLKENIQPLRDMLDMLSDGMMQAIRDMEAIQRQKLSPSDKKALQRVLNKEEGAVLPKSLQKYWSLYETINKNKGEYLTRSYQAFEDPDWKEKTLRKKALMNRAKDFIREQNPSLTEGEVLGEVSAILQSAKESGDFLTLISQGEKLGSKDTAIITRRKDIPPVILELLGEYKDPKINFVRSASKMQYYIANHNFLMDLRRSGLNVFLFEKATVNKGGSYDAQVATKDSDAMNPLNGLYTTADFKQGLKDASDKFQGTELMRNIIRVNSMVKYGKTILSPTTQARNFMSAAMFSVMNGHSDWTHMGKAFKAAKSDLFTHDKKWRAYLDKLIGMGVIHDNPFAGELRDAIKDFTDYDTYSTGPNQNFRKILNFFQRSYQVGDDFWKIIGYENEVALQKKAGLSQAEAEKKAAYRIRNGYPTYSMVPKGIKAIRRWPLLGTFVSFPYEIMRTTKNQLDFIKEDMAKPETRPMAVRRALGFAMASSAAYAASITSMAAMGMDSDDDEAVRAQLPEWSRNSQLLYMGYDEDGLPVYLDLSYLDPYTYIKKPLTAILSGNNEGIDDKIVDALREFLDPFIGADIAAGAIGEIIYNQKRSGGQVYNPEAQGHEKANDILQHLRKAIQPGILSNMERTIKAIDGDVSPSGKKYSIKDEGLAWIGLRFGTLNLRQSMIYKGYGFSDRKSQSSRILNRTVGSAGTVSEKKIKDSVHSMLLARERAYSEMSKLVEGAMKLGVSKADIRRSLKAANISRKDVSFLLKGKTPRWIMSNTFLKSARARAISATTSPERKRELREEMRERKRIVRETIRGERGK